MVKNLAAKQEMPVSFLGQEALLEKETATHSSILAGKSHGQKSLAWWVQSMESQRLRYDFVTKQHNKPLKQRP